MSAYDGLAAALAELATGDGGDAAWLCVERSSRIAIGARIRAMGRPSTTTREDLSATVFGRLAGKAVTGELPAFTTDKAAGSYFAATARSVIVDAARIRKRDTRIEADTKALAETSIPGDDPPGFDAEMAVEAGRACFSKMVALLRESRRPQDRPSLDRAAASLQRIAFEGMALDTVLQADGEWGDDPAGQQRARDRRYQAHKRLRDQLVDLAGKPEAASLLAPWSGALAQSFFARWLIRCQVRCASASSAQGALP